MCRPGRQCHYFAPSSGKGRWEHDGRSARARGLFHGLFDRSGAARCCMPRLTMWWKARHWEIGRADAPCIGFEPADIDCRDRRAPLICQDAQNGAKPGTPPIRFYSARQCAIASLREVSAGWARSGWARAGDGVAVRTLSQCARTKQKVIELVEERLGRARKSSTGARPRRDRLFLPRHADGRSNRPRRAHAARGISAGAAIPDLPSRRRR